MRKSHAKKIQSREKPIYWVLPLVLAVACIIAYYPILTSGFLSDDWLILYEIKHGSITDIGTQGSFFRPLGIISFAIDLFLFSEHPFAFHFINLLMHFAASLGVALSASLVLRKTSAGLLAGSMFAIHPIHPEAVSWIAGRYDVLCGALLAWAFFCYLRSYETNVNKPNTLRIISLFLFALACLTKEMAFSFPFLIILCEFLPVGNIINVKMTLRTKAMRVIPFIIVAVILFILRWFRLKGIGAAEYLPHEEEGMLLAQLLYQILVQPLVLLFLPLNRFILEPTTSPSVIMVEIALLLPLLLLTQKQNWRVVAFCAAATILSFLPTAHLGVEGWKLMSSRFLYTPSIFFSILITALFISSERLGRQKTMALIIGGVYLASMLMCINQNNYAWQQAGKLVRTAAASTDKLVGKYEGDWGINRNRLLIVNVPRGYMGAYVFQVGLPHMLRLRHGDILDDVDIEVIFEDAGHGGTYAKMEDAFDEGAVVWGFDYETWVFIEYKAEGL
jgi:hypothetical protein